MKKVTYRNTNLDCLLQSTSEMNSSCCPTGVLSLNPRSYTFRFEEIIRKIRSPRNPKLFDGKYCSLVHMRNGRYKIHLKSFEPQASTDRNELAFNIYCEIINALKILE